MNMEKNIFDVIESSGSNEVLIWTSHLKIHGFVYMEKENRLKDMITLNGALVCTHHDKECHCSDDKNRYKWLNLAEEKIIAFTVLQDCECC